MAKDQAEKFAKEWVAAWNAHDLPEILSHYEEEFEMSSPAITKLSGDPSGTLKGKQAVAEYWAGALAKYPRLKFELLHVLRGANSVILIYKGVLGLSAEVFQFGASGKVAKACAHYDL
ncbi:MAG: nuclear transport factor 2 family protein [Desulfobulbaceae bacterium]|nr:MAG: nuclear transport factor 2 family protein [Desulfobulbaceae bacterium]